MHFRTAFIRDKRNALGRRYCGDHLAAVRLLHRGLSTAGLQRRKELVDVSLTVGEVIFLGRLVKQHVEFATALRYERLSAHLQAVFREER
jgi:hypothetical protein